MLVVLEANKHVQELLENPPEASATSNDRSGGSKLDKRPNFYYWVVRGNEEKAILLAGRRDNTHAVERVHYEIHDDHEYKEKRQRKMARTRIMYGEVTMKQNIGHIGKEVVVLGAIG